MSWTFEHLAGSFEKTEGPAYDGESVLFTDIPTSNIHRYDLETGETSLFRDDVNHANGLAFGPDGNLYGCEGGQAPPPEGRRIVRLGADQDADATVVRSYGGRRLNSPNDLVFDEAGRIWFTDPRYGGKTDDLELDHESVYRVDRQPGEEWSIERVTTDTTKPNGILVSPDQQWLYVAQTEPPRPDDPTDDIELRAYPINDDGSLGDYRVLHNFYPHRGIDGMTIDTEGNIIATAGGRKSGPGPMLYVFAPNGRVLETHPFPADKPTNCTFGGPDLQSLYVTGGGGLYRAETDRTGYLQYPQLSPS